MKNLLFPVVLLAHFAILAPNLLVAAGAETEDNAAHHEGCGHAHHAPHLGALIPLGDHVGHVELLLDPAQGTVRLYVLGAHAENPIRIADHEITIDLQGIDGRKISTTPLVMNAQANLLTGEKVGDTSEFVGTHANLVGAQAFHGSLRAITLRGVAFTDVAVSGKVPTHEHEEQHQHEHGDHGHEH